MSTRGEMSPRRRRTSPPPASLPDDDDLLREILLRLPPRPSSLPRASLVSKRWRSLVADPQFQRRFRDHHGKPPLLGFFVDEYSPCPLFPLLDQPDRIPGARFSMPLREGNRIRIVDCRHGLVLTFSSRQTTWRPRHLFVWDPVAREQRCLIFPPELDVDKMFIFNGAVLRPVRGHGHFQVVLVAHYLPADISSSRMPLLIGERQMEQYQLTAAANIYSIARTQHFDWEFHLLVN
nr:uncharacterized protein LOC109778427 [Aegilops tauschii subsp. strangulata]